MKVLNVHSRVIECQKSQIDQLLESLTSREDKVWPSEHWPKIFFKDGTKRFSISKDKLLWFLK